MDKRRLFFTAPESGGGGTWNVSDLVYNQSFNQTHDSTAYGFFISPDGTKLYQAGNIGDVVLQYSISNYNVSTAVFVRSLNISIYETQIRGVSFDPTGTYMFITGSIGDDINRATLSTAWDISTATSWVTKSIATEQAGIFDFYISEDGLHLYVIGNNPNAMFEYSMATPWDISGLTLVRSKTTSAVFGFTFKPDGTMLYEANYSLSTVSQYSLSTPWNISTTTFVADFDTSPQGANNYYIRWNNDGSKAYTFSPTLDVIYQYNT